MLDDVIHDDNTPVKDKSCDFTLCDTASTFETLSQRANKPNIDGSKTTTQLLVNWSLHGQT